MDRLLDFSRAISGNLFFAPSSTFLENVGDDGPAAAVALPVTPIVAPSRSAVTVRDGSLGIGSLKGDPSHE
jgi:putative iron-dependent peroxidase